MAEIVQAGVSHGELKQGETDRPGGKTGADSESRQDRKIIPSPYNTQTPKVSTFNNHSEKKI